MPLTLTEKAVQRVRFLLEKEGRAGSCFRVGVQGGGCSGLVYTMGVEDAPAEGDRVFDFDGVRVLCDFKSYLYLNCTTMDWHEEMMQASFRFLNPAAKSTCGCGESFSV
ncbi:MAG: iron-sulfur cluster assembly accessory protein [Planctomycetes bacterium]|nr:iron-sulfur cluster assembly accessory protein [Planctomycetota bacterium]